ncbi:MAG: STAS domain-containing protein [Paludibacteraceae bacterium]|nr:STAS domain-containing protein [Paludibacteraceae bacterium]
MTLNIISSSEQIIGKLIGRLDTDAASDVESQWNALIESANRHIVLDCTELEYISSSGLRLFLTLQKATMAKGGHLTLREVNPSVKQVFNLTGFSSIFAFE